MVSNYLPVLLPMNRDLKGRSFTKNPLAQHTPSCMDTPWSFWGSMLLHSLQGQNVTTAMLRTHTQRSLRWLWQHGGVHPGVLRIPRKVPKFSPSLRLTPHRGNYAAFQLWFNIPKFALTRFIWFIGFFGFIPQRGGCEGWERLCHPEPPSHKTPISILVPTLDFSGDLEERSLKEAGTGKALGAFSLLYKALSARAASSAKAPGGFVPRWPLHPCRDIPTFQAGPVTRSPDFSREQPPEWNLIRVPSWKKENRGGKQKSPRAQRTRIKLLGMDRQQVTKFLFSFFFFPVCF